MKLVRLRPSQVKLGVPLPWNVRLEDGGMFLTRGHVIESQHQLDLILARGMYIDQREAESYYTREMIAEAPKEAPTIARQNNLFDLWEKVNRRHEELFKGFPQAPPDFLPQLESLANDIVSLMVQDADIGIFQALRQEHAAFSTCGYVQSVDAALVSTLIARRMHWPQAQVLTLVKAALSMNAPILVLLGRMASQEGPVLDKQRAEVQSHPDKAVAWLQQQGVTDADWLKTVAQHHERADGSGFPHGVTDVSPLAQALRMADIFTAKINRRLNREPLSPQEAARHLLHEAGGGPLALALIQEIGIYPPGDFVKLKSGEQAVVIQRGANPKTPVVACITDAAGKPGVHTAHRDTAQPEFQIVGVVADKAQALRVPPERLYGFAAGHA
jgi:HD-GYP domain-containing protein (c-di-GMP phosphodiesterase class II)